MAEAVAAAAAAAAPAEAPADEDDDDDEAAFLAIARHEAADVQRRHLYDVLVSLRSI